MTALLVAVDWLDLLSTIGLAGGYIFAALIAAPAGAGRRGMRWAGVALAIALLAELALNAIRMAALSSAGGLAFVGELSRMRWCRLWLGRCAGLAMLLRLRPGSGAAAGLAALWLSLRSLQGHAGAHGTMPAAVDWLHLLAAASWLGSLVQIGLMRGSAPPMVATRLRRLALTAVTALVACGVWSAWLYIPNVEQLVNSPYGRALLVKLMLAAGLLSLGATNSFRYVPALRRDPGGAAGQRLLRVVRWELVIAALVLLMSALLGGLPMPQAPLR